MTKSIKLNSLTKKYGPQLVLNNINLEVNPGEFVSLVGPVAVIEVCCVSGVIPLGIEIVCIGGTYVIAGLVSLVANVNFDTHRIVKKRSHYVGCTTI